MSSHPYHASSQESPEPPRWRVVGQGVADRYSCPPHQEAGTDPSPKDRRLSFSLPPMPAKRRAVCYPSGLCTKFPGLLLGSWQKGHRWLWHSQGKEAAPANTYWCSSQHPSTETSWKTGDGGGGCHIYHHCTEVFLVPS